MSQQESTVMSDPIQNEVGQTSPDQSTTRVAAAGGILAGLAASTCCVLPLALTMLGVSGAWMANMRALGAFQPYFIGIAVLALAYGFYQVYWKPKTACAEGDACARPMNNTLVKAGLWLGTLIVLTAITFPFWFTFVLPYLP